MSEPKGNDEPSGASGGYLDDYGVFCRPRRAAPPIGIMPTKLWLEHRCDDILEAMERYRRFKYIIPADWAEELAGHLRTIKGLR